MGISYLFILRFMHLAGGLDLSWHFARELLLLHDLPDFLHSTALLTSALATTLDPSLASLGRRSYTHLDLSERFKT